MAFQQALLAHGKITGNLVNNAKPVEFATVPISNVQDSNKILFYEATDSLGNFSFDKLDYGKYLVKIKMDDIAFIINELSVESNIVFK